jgi:hypothetical protein
VIGADWTYPEESAAGWDYPEGLSSYAWGWDYSNYVSVFWGVVAKHLLEGGNWDTIPWSELAAPFQLDWARVGYPVWRYSRERFLRGAYEAADGQSGKPVHQDALMQALEISEDMYEAWIDHLVSDGSAVLVRPPDYTTFALTSKGAQAVNRSLYYRFLRAAYEAANGQPGKPVRMDSVYTALGEIYAVEWVLNRQVQVALIQEGDVDWVSGNTFVLNAKAIQKIERTTKVGQ